MDRKIEEWKIEWEKERKETEEGEKMYDGKW